MEHGTELNNGMQVSDGQEGTEGEERTDGKQTANGKEGSDGKAETDRGERIVYGDDDSDDCPTEVMVKYNIVTTIGDSLLKRWWRWNERENA